MIFGNNIERMAFEKSGWVLTYVYPDGTVYKCKPTRSDAMLDNPCWYIMRTIKVSGKDGVDVYETSMAYPFGKCSLEDFEKLDYRHF